jgi:hypothetical protein
MDWLSKNGFFKNDENKEKRRWMMSKEWFFPLFFRGKIKIDYKIG